METVDVIAGRMPALKEIELCSTEWTIDQRHFPTILSSNLLHFRTDLDVILPPSLLGRDLRELEITVTTPECTPLTLLASHINLEVAVFHISKEIHLPSSAVHGVRVHAPNLTDLELSLPDARDWTVFRSIMTNLYAPRLEAIKLHISGSYANETISDWQMGGDGTFGLASATRVIIEYGGGDVVSYANLLHALSLFDSVEHLELNGMRIQSSLDERVLRRLEHEQMFPKLRTLLLRDAHFGGDKSQEERAKYFAHLATWREHKLGTMVVGEARYESSFRDAIEDSIRCSSKCSLVWREGWRGRSPHRWQIGLGEDLQSCDRQLSSCPPTCFRHGHCPF